MPRDVYVTTAHLGELSATQGQAAAEIQSATEVTGGVDASVRISHGVIAWSTAAAVEATNNARRTAGTAMADKAAALSDKLTTAAARYDDTDERVGGRLDGQMRAW